MADENKKMNHQRYSKRTAVNTKTMNESFNILKGKSDENKTGAKEKSERREVDETNVLKDETKKHTNVPTRQDEGICKEKVIKDAAKEEFSKLSCEDKVLRVRRKLEKIIHKKETDQNKAMDLLRILERIEITEVVLSSTKIDLTLEALRFIIKDENIKRKTEKVLKILKQSKEHIKPIKISSKDWRETEDKFPDNEKANEEIVILDDQPAINTRHWMDEFIEKDKKLGEKLDTLNKKLEAMSSDVQEIGPTCKSSSDTPKDKLVKANASSKTDSKKSTTEERVLKIKKNLDKILSSEETEEAYSHLKKLSELTLNKEIIKNTKIEKTIRAIEKKSSDAKVLKQVKKTMEKIKCDKKVDDDLDSIADSISQMNIKDKTKRENNKEFIKATGNERDKKKASNVFDEIELMSETINLLSLKEKSKVSKESPKLFSDPNKIKNREESKKNKETKKEKDSTSDDPDSLTNRLKRLEIENKLLKFKNKFDEFDPKTEEKDQIIESLVELEQIEVTLDLLESTKIGISLQKFRKTLADESASKQAKDIIRKWKLLVPEENRKSKVKDVQEEQNEAEKEEREREQKKKEERENTEKVRNHCKGLLYSSLSENDSIPASCQVNVKKLADAIEEAIFENYKETNQKYRSQIQSRQYNIKKNLTLQENLILGNISSDEVAIMSHEDMANDDLKKMREDLKKKGFDCIPTSHVADDMFCTCRICLPPWIHK